MTVVCGGMGWARSSRVRGSAKVLAPMLPASSGRSVPSPVDGNGTLATLCAAAVGSTARASYASSTTRVMTTDAAATTAGGAQAQAQPTPRRGSLAGVSCPSPASTGELGREGSTSAAPDTTRPRYGPQE